MSNESETFLRVLVKQTLLFVFVGLSVATAVGDEVGDIEVSVGIGGCARKGLWTECRISGLDSAVQQVVIATRDGDGVEVNYDLSVQSGSAVGYFQVDDVSSQVRILLLDDSGNVLDRRAISNPRKIPYKQSWIVSVGESIGIEAASDEQGRRNYPMVAGIQDGSEMPRHWIAYNGVNLFVLTGSNAAIVNELEDAQKQALADWVRRGGRMMITLGGEATSAVAEGSWIEEYLGLQLGDEEIDVDPRAIESFTATQVPLKSYTALKLPTEGGRLLLTGRTVDRQTVPIAKEYLVGFGRVTVIAAALDAEPFASWPDRERLLERFLPATVISPSATQQRGKKNDTVYSDLVGQIRRSLDQFQSQWRVPFKWIAACLVGFLALIGPVDYWVVNRWLRRPMVGWISFPLAVVLFSAIALYASTYAVPNEPSVNQVAVIDLAPIGKVGRGFVWSQFLSSQAGKRDFSYEITGDLGKAEPRVVSGWWGLSGSEFGGLASTGQDEKLPTYSVVRSSDDQRLATNLRQIPFATAATKGMAGWWQFEPSVTVDAELRQRPGTDLLRGPVTNPLPVELHNPVLVYRGWVYMLPTRLSAGKRLPEISNMTYKNLKSRLTRRTVKKGASTREKWNPEMDSDIDRIMEIVMLYKAAGGENYTVLENRIIGDLDLSYTLETDHAILMGRVDEPIVRLNAGNALASGAADNIRTFVRVLLPVDTKRK